MIRIMTILLTMSLAATAQAASTVTVTDADANNYGKVSGIAIDFDATTGLAADWTPDLTNGRLYRVDSVSLYLGDQGLIGEDLYLGVYTELTDLGTQAAATLSGFLGVSDNTFNLSTAPLDTALTWTFAGIAPEVAPRNNPGAGDDKLYFVLQTGTDALIDTGSMQTDDRPFRRIDGGDGSFADELSAVIHGSRNDTLTDSDVVTARALEYEAQVTDIGEAPPVVVPDPEDSAVVVTDGDANNYGKTSGVVIDFDASTGLSAAWTPELAAGTAYQLDSLTLFLGDPGAVSEELYLGVYTGLDEQIGVTNAAALSGFLGVSDNTFNLSTAPLDTALIWTFAGIAPEVTPENNPGSGGDILYFVLQTGTNALVDVGSIQSDDRPFRRIDGEAGSFSDELGAVIHGSRNNNAASPDIVDNRVLEYEAQLSVAGLSYSAWISQFDTGGLDSRSDDVEPDGMNNEIEYYLGGNPTLFDAAAIMPMGSVVDMGGSNVFEYIYRRRTDNTGLTYDLRLNTNSLIVGEWNSVSNAYQVGVGPTAEKGVESVTNHFPTADLFKFVELEVAED